MGDKVPWSSTREYAALRARWYNLRKNYPDHTWVSFQSWRICVGKAPKKNYTLRPKDVSRPLGPDNWCWQKWVNPSRKPNVWKTNTKEGKAAYDRFLRQRDPDRERRAVLKRFYGMSLAEYDLMMARQGGVCAICGKPETVTKLGRPMRLTVDHCHDTGKVRGLLCTRCNRGIGLLGDKPEVVRSALHYLESQAGLASVAGYADSSVVGADCVYPSNKTEI